MGEFNSSVTRVWPIFDWLFRSDPTGVTWLTSLLHLGSRANEVESHLLFDPGPLCARLARFERPLPGPLSKALGQERAVRVGRIRNAYETEVPPSTIFLRWLLEHPEKLIWPKEASNRDRVYSPKTEQKRKRLLAGELGVRRQALEELAMVEASGSRQKWWAFEGFTSVDCFLETRSLILLIEGKRKEPISKSTDWYPYRNQVIRNLEVAQTLAQGREFAVLLCAEILTEFPEKTWTDSLPHLSAGQVKDLRRHYLGCATWSMIAQHLCVGLWIAQYTG